MSPVECCIRGRRRIQEWYFCHAINFGKGAAIRTGLVHANAQSVLIQDADLEYSPKDYGRLFDCMSRCDAMIVYESRFLNPKQPAAV